MEFRGGLRNERTEKESISKQNGRNTSAAASTQPKIDFKAKQFLGTKMDTKS